MTETLANKRSLGMYVIRTLREAWATYYRNHAHVGPLIEPYLPPSPDMRGFAEMVLAKGVIPAEWIWWSLGIWDTHMRVKAALAGDARTPHCPSVKHWILSPAKVEKHYGWYAHSAGRRLGGLTSFSPEAVAYGAAYQRLQYELCSAPSMPTEARVRYAVKLHFEDAGLNAEKLALAASARSAELRDLAENWHFIWGT